MSNLPRLEMKMTDAKGEVLLGYWGTVTPRAAEFLGELARDICDEIKQRDVDTAKADAMDFAWSSS